MIFAFIVEQYHVFSLEWGIEGVDPRELKMELDLDGSAAIH